MKSKKGVLGTLVTAGIGIVILAVVAVLGITMLLSMGSAVSDCQSPLSYNSTSKVCWREYCPTGTVLNTSYSDYSATPCENQTRNITCCPASQNYSIQTESGSASIATQSANYGGSYLGNDSGGLLTYLPVIIPAIAVISILGLLFGIWKFGGKNQAM